MKHVWFPGEGEEPPVDHEKDGGVLVELVVLYPRSKTAALAADHNPPRKPSDDRTSASLPGHHLRRLHFSRAFRTL